MTDVQKLPAEVVTALVAELTTTVIKTLGTRATNELNADGLRHVLSLKLSKVVAEHLMRIASERG